jgi:hypothetical protein
VLRAQLKAGQPETFRILTTDGPCQQDRVQLRDSEQYSAVRQCQVNFGKTLFVVIAEKSPYFFLHTSASTQRRAPFRSS